MSDHQESRDSSPLDLDQLSDEELAIIIEIERPLCEAQQSTIEQNAKKRIRQYLAPVEVRHPRVLLLDGGRGTGKTSMLLTLAHRWTTVGNLDSSCQDTRSALEKKKYEDRITRVRALPKFTPNDNDSHIPAHVSVVGRILDFDPLPPGMPVIAWIVEAWRELAQEYDRLSGDPEDCDEGETLSDCWRRLFHMAAIGWSRVSTNKGLIEQVLDREQQVQDWQNLDKHWQSFVDRVISHGKCLKKPHKFSQEPVFVIMIDDCDLQVARIGELLPALRLLYHPRVFFLVAAHRPHMIDMLTLDFLGQQNKLANCQLQGTALAAGDSDRWASHLADSSFEKVFPIKNRWVLHQLSLHELLDFPHGNQAPSFESIFNTWRQHPAAHEPSLGNLGTYLRSIAGTREQPAALPLKWTYRTAHQIFERVRRDQLEEPSEIKAKNPEESSETTTQEETSGSSVQGMKDRAAEAIGRLIGGADYDELVRISGWGGGGSKAQISSENQPSIEYLGSGKLTVFSPGEFTYKVAGTSTIVLSGQPRFRYSEDAFSDTRPVTGPWEARSASAIIAQSLHDDHYGVDAPSLQWDIGLALAWTRVNLPTIDLAFRWRLHQHPSPLRLLYWARDWRRFIVDLDQHTEYRLDRIAYAWIYYQLRWLSKDGAIEDLKGVPGPLSEEFNDESSWDALLHKQPEIGTVKEKSEWHCVTLPLLAPPEIGLSTNVQEKLLRPVEGDSDAIAHLWEQRRRSVTGAILAAAEEKRVTAENAEDESRVDRIVAAFETRHQGTYKNMHSRWWEIVEQPRVPA